jgi:glycosyltransferase involved in cell wall biosynthesis
VFRRPWRGHFADARNQSIALATGQWIVYIDADEQIRRPVDSRRLRRLLNNPRVLAMSVDLYATARATPLRTFRLFRRDPRIQFEGAMHETMMRGVERIVRDEGALLRNSGLIVDHVGYDGDPRVKARRNLPILRRALKEDPHRIWNRAHLALVYASLGRTRDAIRTWQRGIADVRRKRSTDLLDSLAHVGYASWLLANRKPAGRVLADGLKRFPGNLELHWINARWLMTRKRWLEAIPILEGLARHHGHRKLDRRLPYPGGIVGADAFEALGTCHFKLRQYRDAARWYSRAARAAPDKIEYRIKADLARRTARGEVLSS